MYRASLGAAPAYSTTICTIDSDPEFVKAAQHVVNLVLARMGYERIPESGKLDPQTCGALALLEEWSEGAPKCDIDPELAKAVADCVRAAMPTKKPAAAGIGGIALGALPACPKPDAEMLRAAQALLNIALVRGGGKPITVSGVFDQATCGAVTRVLQMLSKCNQQALEQRLAVCREGQVMPQRASSMTGWLIGGVLLLGIGGIAWAASRGKKRRAA